MINFDTNKLPKILVVGDLMIDKYLWGSSERISPEAPVPVININHENEVLGGAGNVVNNLTKLGAHVDIYSVIGDCTASSDIIELLSEIGVNTQNLIKQKNRILSKKTRIIASHQQVVRYDLESKDDIEYESEDKLINNLQNIIDYYEVILLSDYGKGVLTKKVTKTIIDLANSKGIKVLVDPKGHDYSKYSGAFLLTPNKKEASEITKIDIKDNKTLINAAKKLKTDLELKISLITLSEQGIAIYDEDLRVKPTITKEVFDVTGAGDTVLASLGYALAFNSKIDDAVEFANLAAGVVVSKIGSATATMNEIIEHETSLNKSTSDKHIKNYQEISKISDECRNKNRKIVFTNGCFDILHAGHVRYLAQAKARGDKLVVGLNNDQSIARLKGSDRPINNLEERATVLMALASVDWVIPFGAVEEDDTPARLIKQINPDILVKGGDYKIEDIAGADTVLANGGRVEVLEFVNNCSTSNVINKIKTS